MNAAINMDSQRKPLRALWRQQQQEATGLNAAIPTNLDRPEFVENRNGE
jgi:hypothetical protein